MPWEKKHQKNLHREFRPKWYSIPTAVLELVLSGAEDMMPFMMNRLTMDLSKRCQKKEIPPSIRSLKENSEFGRTSILNSRVAKKSSNSDLFDESTDFKKDHLSDWTRSCKHRQGTDVRVLGKAKSPNPCFEYNLANSVNLSVEFSTLPPSPFLYQIHGWLRCICYEHTKHTSELPNIQ